jgi:hypothetical protein
MPVNPSQCAMFVDWTSQSKVIVELTLLDHARPS